MTRRPGRPQITSTVPLSRSEANAVYILEQIMYRQNYSVATRTALDRALEQVAAGKALGEGK